MDNMLQYYLSGYVLVCILFAISFCIGLYRFRDESDAFWSAIGYHKDFYAENHNGHWFISILFIFLTAVNISTFFDMRNKRYIILND